MKILRSNELHLVNYLKGSPFFAKETPIQYGIQYVTDSGVPNVDGVIVNFHYSDRAPLLVSVTIQRETANSEHAALIRHFAKGLEVTQLTSSYSAEFFDW